MVKTIRDGYAGFEPAYPTTWCERKESNLHGLFRPTGISALRGCRYTTLTKMEPHRRFGPLGPCGAARLTLLVRRPSVITTTLRGASAGTCMSDPTFDTRLIECLELFDFDLWFGQV